VTLVLTLSVSAGFGLYLASSSFAGLLQAMIVRRLEAERAPAQ
jgi:hypothetical protein